MKAIFGKFAACFLFVVAIAVKPASADDMARTKLAEALIAGSPWRFSNKHVSEIQQWRRGADGHLEGESSYTPGRWNQEVFTDADTLVHASRAGGNTITYRLDSNGNAVAVHSKNASQFVSLKEAK